MKRIAVYSNRSTESIPDSDSSEGELDPVFESQLQPSSRVETWIRRSALIGDSPTALCLSALLLIISLAMTLYTEKSPYERLGPIPIIDPPRIFSLQSEQMEPACERQLLEAYQKDGVVAVRGLVSNELLERLVHESNVFIDDQLEKKGSRSRDSTQFFTSKHGVIFRNDTTAFLQLALNSSVSKLAATLLRKSNPLLTKESSIRMLRDILLAKDKDPYICGYHVDDLGFWPATPESDGINAWVALTDMPIHVGGGFALAVGSHTAPWRHDAYRATGASAIFPKGGYKNAQDMLDKRSGMGTCNLKEVAPYLHQRMEETKRVYDIRKGDVIFHTRWLFHRTVAFNQTMVARNQDPIFRRYSIRYAPGSAIIPPGFSTELSVLWNHENAGRTADQVADHDGPWYPKVWPAADGAEIANLPLLAQEKLLIAEERRQARMKEMAPLIKNKVKQNNPTRQIPPSSDQYL